MQIDVILMVATKWTHNYNRGHAKLECKAFTVCVENYCALTLGRNS